MRKLALLTYLLSFLPVLSCISQACDFQKDLPEIMRLNEKGNFEEALEKLELELQCALENNLTEAHFQALLIKFELERNLRKYRRANRTLDIAHKLWQRNEQLSHRKNELWLALAESAALMGKKELTERYQEDLKQWFLVDESSNQVDLAYLKFIEGFTIQKIYHIEGGKALEAYQEALNLYLKMEQAPTYHLGQTLRYLGAIARMQADFEKSLEYYGRELALYEQHYPVNHFEISAAHFNIANVHYELINFEEALGHYLFTYDIWKDRFKPENRYMQMLNTAIGDMYWELGNREKSLEFFDRSVVGEKKLVNDIGIEKVEVGDSLLQAGDYSGALGYYQHALEFREEVYGKKHPQTAVCQNFVARAFHSSGALQASLKAYQQSLNMLVDELSDTSLTANPSPGMKVNSVQYLLEALIGKGTLLKEKYETESLDQDLHLAFETLDLAIHYMEQLRKGPVTDASRIFWTKRAFPTLENAIALAAILYQKTGEEAYLNKAFQISEKGKAFILLSAVQEIQSANFAGLPDSLLEKENRLKKSIAEYEGKIAQEEQRCADLRPKIMKLWKGKLLALKADYDALLNILQRDYPKYFSLRFDVETVDVQTVRKELLKDNSAAFIEFFEGEKNIFVFLITQTDFQIFQTQNDESYLALTEQFSKNLNQNHSFLSNPAATFQNYTQSAYGLFEKIMKTPLRSISEPIDRLFIVPDNRLFYLPLECLLTGQVDPSKRDYKNLPYLFIKYSLSYCQSASLWVINHQNGQSGKKTYPYLGFAPDYRDVSYPDLTWEVPELQYHKREVKEASEALKGDIFYGDQVSESLFRKYAPKAQILHLAMHALVEDEQPLLSKMLFSTPDTLDDGQLHVYELYGQNLNADLILLSACQTAIGKWESGEGMLSLERGFQYAGCPSLLTTLWTVDDVSTATMVNHFLKNIKAGLKKDHALRLAKIQFLEATDPAALPPYFWAGFRLTGNIDSLEIKPGAQSGWMYLFGVLIVAALVFIINSKQKKGALLSQVI